MINEASKMNGPNGTILFFLKKKENNAKGIAVALAKNISKKIFKKFAYVDKSLTTIGDIALKIDPTKNISLTSPPPNASSPINLLPTIIIKYINIKAKVPYIIEEIPSWTPKNINWINTLAILKKIVTSSEITK